MYRRFHDRFGTAGVVIAVLALIAALGGTAIAAGGLTGKQKKEVTKIAKKYAGKPGAPGAQGPAGPTGAPGKDGADGKNGTNGTDGTDGADGNDGNTVLSAAAPPDDELDGVDGDFYIDTNANQIYGPKTAGAWGAPTDLKGTDGEDGDPWTLDGTLPSGATLTGTYKLDSSDTSPAEALEGLSVTAISFQVPLASPITGSDADNYVEFGETDPDCDDGVAPVPSASNPEADSGKFCLFDASEGIEVSSGGEDAVAPFTLGFGFGVSTAGALLLAPVPAGEMYFGSWAVTG